MTIIKNYMKCPFLQELLFTCIAQFTCDIKNLIIEYTLAYYLFHLTEHGIRNTLKVNRHIYMCIVFILLTE